jgi:hypothetical protein
MLALPVTGSGLRRVPALVALLIVCLTVLPAEAAGPGQAADAASVVERYNAGIRFAEGAVESLRVWQDMDEPQTDGTMRQARAVLSYAKGKGMERRVLSSNLTYPAGEYTLTSLIGPLLEMSEYRIRLEGTEVVDGVNCYHLVVEATVRDKDHLDGDVWVSQAGFAPVRIAGTVSAPPFPLAEIRLDKRFAPGPGGAALLRSHTGEVRAGLVLGGKRGVRHITYRDYIVNGVPEE